MSPTKLAGAIVQGITEAIAKDAAAHPQQMKKGAPEQVLIPLVDNMTIQLLRQQSLVVMPPKGVSKALCFNTPGKTMPSVGEDVPEPYTWQHKVRDPLGPFASTQVAQEQLAKLRESGTRAIAAFQDEAQANRERAIYLNKLSMPYGWDTKIKVGVAMPDDLIRSMMDKASDPACDIMAGLWLPALSGTLVVIVDEDLTRAAQESALAYMSIRPSDVVGMNDFALKVAEHEQKHGKQLVHVKASVLGYIDAIYHTRMVQGLAKQERDFVEARYIDQPTCSLNVMLEVLSFGYRSRRADR